MTTGFVIFTDLAEFESFEDTECLRRGYPKVNMVNGVPAPQNQQTVCCCDPIANMTPGDYRVAAFIDDQWPANITSGWTFVTKQYLYDENFFKNPADM